MRGIQVNGVRFRQIRLACQLTQQQLATLAGVSERTVRNAESGQRVRLDFLNYLATALGIAVAEVIYDPEELKLGLRENRRLEHVLAAIDAHVKENNHGELFGLMTRDVVFHSPGPAEIPYSGEYRGTDAIRTFFDRTTEAIAYEGAPEIRSIRTGGNLVVISGFDNLRAIPTDKTFASTWMHVYEFQNDRIVRVDSWSDTASVAEAFRPGK